METIRGIVDKGNIRLVTPHLLPHGAEIKFEPRLVQDMPERPSLGCNSPELHEILNRSHDTGIPDLAERHNDHQP